MGYASSNAVRRDDAYGSLGGSFGGTERKLKKKPVLVLDPEELAKAHQLFQIGAAEQLGEFDPRNRISVPAAAVFGMILGGVKFQDEEDDYVAPADAAPLDLADDEEEPEDALPPIDLEALLALTQAEQEAEDEFQRNQAAAALAFEAEDEQEAAEPAEMAEQTEVPEIVPPAPTADASTADALARILSRAAARPQQSSLLADLDLSTFEPASTEVERVEPAAQPESEEFVQEQPAAADQPAEEPQWIRPEPVAEPEAKPEIAFSDDSWPEFETSEDDFEPLDLPLADALDGGEFVHAEAPSRTMPVIGEEGVRSTLRARLVREEVSFAHPEPTAWSKLANAVRRLWQRFS